VTPNIQMEARHLLRKAWEHEKRRRKTDEEGGHRKLSNENGGTIGTGTMIFKVPETHKNQTRGMKLVEESNRAKTVLWLELARLGEKEWRKDKGRTQHTEKSEKRTPEKVHSGSRKPTRAKGAA